MNSASLFQSYADAWRIWSQFGSRYTEMMFASAQVVTHRTDRMRAAGASPNAEDSKEFSLMKQEKVDAAVESVQAMTIESMLASQRFAMFAFGRFFSSLPTLFSLALPGTARQVSERRVRLVRTAVQQSALSANKFSAATGKIVQKGLTPVTKRATANAKRLRKAR